jgi:hypothetical protein
MYLTLGTQKAVETANKLAPNTTVELWAEIYEDNNPVLYAQILNSELVHGDDYLITTKEELECL